MAPGSSTDAGTAYSAEQRRQLTELARRSIAHGVAHGRPLEVDPADYPESLREPRACFVTLNEGGELRGCIGSIEARRPLVQDVAENAYAAAFEDPRFARLAKEELDGLEIHISVLTVPQLMRFDSEQDLLRQVRPGIDGLIIRDGFHRGTFLPSVWESLPRAQDFLRHLKLKAGMTPDYWSDSISVERYTTESW
jgi:AmmeMemoRadiSam system protein A